jgi:biotin carboxylase
VGVSFCATLHEVLSHSTALLMREHNERGIRIARRVLVESFVRGPEFSVETFGERAIGVTQKHLGALPSFVELGHDFPAPLDAVARTELTDAALGALQALGLDFGPAHVEVKLSSTGPVIVEVNPRLAGGFIPELVRHATGIDLVRETVRAALGGVPSLAATHSAHASIRFFIPPHDGTLESVEGLSQTDGVVDARAYVARGTPVAVRGDFRDRIGHVLTVGSDGETARRTADRAVAAVRLQVRRPCVPQSRA